MSDANRVEQPREVLEAKGVADPKIHEDLMELKSEVTRLKVLQDANDESIERMRRERDLALSMHATAESRDRLQRADAESKLQDLKKRFDEEETACARAKVAQFECNRLLMNNARTLREYKIKALGLELKLLFISLDSSAKTEQDATAKAETTSAVASAKSSSSAQATTDGKGPRKSNASPSEVSPPFRVVKKAVLSPAFESKVDISRRQSKGNEQGTGLPAKAAAQGSRKSINTPSNASKKLRLSDSEDEASEDDDDDATPSSKRRKSSASSGESKKKAKPRYSNKAKPPVPQDAFTAFDLTKRMAAPKLKSN